MKIYHKPFSGPFLLYENDCVTKLEQYWETWASHYGRMTSFATQRLFISGTFAIGKILQEERADMLEQTNSFCTFSQVVNLMRHVSVRSKNSTVALKKTFKKSKAVQLWIAL